MATQGNGQPQAEEIILDDGYEVEVQHVTPKATVRWRNGEIEGQQALYEEAMSSPELERTSLKKRAAAREALRVQREQQLQQSNTQATKQAAQRRKANQPAPKTSDDQVIRTPSRDTERLTAPPKPKRQLHGLFYVGITLLAIVLIWAALTDGASICVSHISDPTYGPTRGMIVSGVFGGGDSQAKPSKLVSYNNDGQVLILKFAANDLNHITAIPGPNLITLNFPDAKDTIVLLATGDYDRDGHQDVKVILLSPYFDFPLHRYQQSYILYGDGKGHLAQRAQSLGA